MVGVAAGAVAQERQALAVVIARHHKGGGRFADIDAVAALGKRIGDACGQDFQRRKAVNRQRRQGIDAAAHHRVAQIRAQQPRRADQRPRAGRAGGGNAVAQPAQTIGGGDEIGGRGQQLLLLAEGQAVPRAAVGNVAEQRNVFVGAAHRSADHHRHPFGAVAGHGSLNLRLDLFERVPQKLVVAADMLGAEVFRQPSEFAVYRAESTVFADYPFAAESERTRRRRRKQAAQVFVQTAAERRNQCGAAEPDGVIHRRSPAAAA